MSIRNLGVFVVLCCVVCLAAPTRVQAAILYVDGTLPGNCPSGGYSVTSRNCAGGDGSGFSTFASAVAAMQPGDTVAIRGGTYRTSLVVTKDGTAAAHLRFIAYAGEPVVIDLAGVTETFVWVGGAPITPSGIESSGRHYIDFEGLTVLNALYYGFRGSLSPTDITITNCEFGYSYHGGIVFEGGANITITHSRIHHSHRSGGTFHEAVTFQNVHQFSMTDSEVYENGKEGIDAKYGSSDGVIARNHIYRNRSGGIYLDAASSISVFGNICHETQVVQACVGVAIESTNNPERYQTRDVAIYNNVMYGSNSGLSFWIQDGGLSWARFERIRIEYNTIVDNSSAGIWFIVEHAQNFGSGMTIRNNIIMGNTSFAIRDDYGMAPSFTIDHNLFQSNEPSATVGSSPIFTTQSPFVDRSTGDYHLTSGSPARFVGQPIPDISTDLTGAPRPATDTDVGAYQYNPASTPDNVRPVADMTADVVAGSVPLTVHFDGSTSYDPDLGDTITYSWDVNGDGVFGDDVGSTDVFTYTTAGVVNVSLRVTDSHGESDTAVLVIAVGANAPAASITTPASSALYRVGDIVAFSGEAIDPDTNLPLPASALSWRVLLNYCAVSNPSDCHEQELNRFNGVAGGAIYAPDHEYPAFLRFELTATKPPIGSQPALSSTVSRTLLPETTTVTLESVPSGLWLTMYDSTATAPVSRTVIVNAQATVSALTPQALGSLANQYQFASWSDGGAQTHVITTSAPLTLTATYAPIPLASVWNSWDVVTQSGAPQGQVTAAATGIAATLEFYESTNNGGVLKGALFGGFNVGTHPDTFNTVERYWGAGSGRIYPYAGKSTVNRGSGPGETNAPLPVGVRDLQVHPPNNLHHVVAAFRVPTNGTYTVSNLGVRRVSNIGGSVGLHVFNAQQAEIALLTATNNQAWVTSPTTYTLPNLTAGAYLYFAVDRAGDYAYDAAEIAWTVTANILAPPPPPPTPSCTLGAMPTGINQGMTTTLTWTSANATSLSIDRGVGAVTPVAGGTVMSAPAVTTLYTATATGPGGTATCTTTVTVTPSASTSVWNSWDVVTQSGTPQGTVTAAATGTTATVEFYESTNNAGVLKGALLSGFTVGAHPDAFNTVERYWGVGTGRVYPYAGKSTVNRGSGPGETNAPLPAGVRDLQLHPPNNLHHIVAAFRVPSDGTYTVSNLGVHRVSNIGGSVGLHVFNAQQAEIAVLTATNNQAWVTSPTTYTLPNLTAGSYLYFAVDRAGDYAYDAAEIAWTVTANIAAPPPPPPPTPSCTLSAMPTGINQGMTTTLTWTSTNATSLSIDHGVGAVIPAAGGTVTSALAVTTVFTATATGPGGTATCATTVTVTPSASTSVWNSWDVVTQSGTPQGMVTAAATGTTATVEFYESTNNGGVLKGALFSSFNVGTHPDTFNTVERYWGAATGRIYPYAGKSTVNRGSGPGETNTPLPLGVRDLQVHPPNNLHHIVAAFRVPSDGTYTVSNLGVRRVSNIGGSVGLHVFNAQQVEIALLTATANQAWVVTPATYTLPNLTAGAYLYFAVDRAGDYAYDAAEIAWTITRTGP